jgi:hypothetical protein
MPGFALMVGRAEFTHLQCRRARYRTASALQGRQIPRPCFRIIVGDPLSLQTVSGGVRYAEHCVRLLGAATIAQKSEKWSRVLVGKWQVHSGGYLEQDQIGSLHLRRHDWLDLTFYCLRHFTRPITRKDSHSFNQSMNAIKSYCVNR